MKKARIKKLHGNRNFWICYYYTPAGKRHIGTGSTPLMAYNLARINSK